MKWKLVCILSLLLNHFQGTGQLVFEKVSHDFGDLYANSDRFVDIRITNKGPKKEYLLRVTKPADLVYLANGQYLEKDSSLIVRLQPNPKNTGKFSYAVEIYTSDKQVPTTLHISGNNKEFPANGMASLQSCPDFNTRPSASATDFQLTVVTIDKSTKKPLSRSAVSLLQNGKPLGQWKTNKNGQIVEKTPLGYTYFYGSHEGYFPAELGSYVNFQRNYVVLELEADPKYGQPVPVIRDTAIAVPEPEPVPLAVQLEQEPATIASTDSLQKIPVDFQQLDPANFDDQYFKPVNLVFVLDVSSSMAAGDKMELMKYALFQLTDVLRPQDQMAIVTYATDARVLLASTKGDRKDEIRAPVEKLRASGSTAGGEGIKLGYKQALKSLLPDGANQVIIITDGAFNRNSDDYQQYIRKYQKKGISLSVVGVKNSDKDSQLMAEAAQIGGGRYVPIFKLTDAQLNLVREIRLSAFRF
jgi:Ca-activated chloride channel family protein